MAERDKTATETARHIKGHLRSYLIRNRERAIAILEMEQYDPLRALIREAQLTGEDPKERGFRVEVATMIAKYVYTPLPTNYHEDVLDLEEQKQQAEAEQESDVKQHVLVLRQEA